MPGLYALYVLVFVLAIAGIWAAAARNTRMAAIFNSGAILAGTVASLARLDAPLWMILTIVVVGAVCLFAALLRIRNPGEPERI
jgi:hypothetical protein